MKKSFTSIIIIIILVLGLMLVLELSKKQPDNKIFLNPPAGTDYPVMSSTTPTIVMKIGDHIMQGEDLITPTAVIEDSRCPAKVVCVWAGKFVLALNISSPDEATSTNLEINKPVTMDGYTITLNNVSPLPESADLKIPLGDYRFTLTIVSTSSPESNPEILQ
jgi:hypothetical protein